MYSSIPYRKTRIAPTPSGYLHLGNILSFSLTAAMAQAANARILLRIDDLDRERYQKAYVQDIFDTLHFLEIPWHEGPKDLQQFEQEYSQLHRMDLYKKSLNELMHTGQVFACNCSRTQISRSAGSGYPGTCTHSNLPLHISDASWRLHTDTERLLSIKTASGNTVTATLPQSVQHFVVKKKDGFPAYQLTSVIDDMHFGIDLIVRGEDLWESTLAQLYLSGIMDYDVFEQAAFYHHPLLMQPDGIKLSKSAGATSIQYLRKEGKKSADIFAMLSAMLQLPAPARTYQQLADAIMAGRYPL